MTNKRYVTTKDITGIMYQTHQAARP